MTRFGDFLGDRLESGGFSTEDVLASILPLMRQVIETHDTGMVAPLDGIECLRVERSAIWFEESSRLDPSSNKARIRSLDPRDRSGVEIIGEHSRTHEVGHGLTEVEDLSIGESGEDVSRPVYLSGYRSWEHAVEHHDPLVDVFSLGLILASLSCGLDFRRPEDLRSFVHHRKNLFALNPGLHPVLAKAIIRMTELSRHRRPPDVRGVMSSLANYRDQEIGFDFDLASIDGFGEKTLEGKQQLILGRLQERLFEISRRNRLLHFRDTSGTVCLTEASVPLSFDVENVRPDQILTWSGSFQSDLSAGKRVSLNRYMNFREALYLAPNLDRIRTESLRDQAEFGFQQLRVVLCFLRWADVKSKPPELYYSPFVLLGVKLIKKKGVRDTYHIEPHGTVAEINPVLRHMLKQLYDIQLPETVDLSVANLEELYQGFKNKVESSDASITVAKIDRPRIELIHEKARRRLAMYRRKVRVSGRGLRRFMDLDYSYNPANFHPLGLRIFNSWIRPAETHLRTILQDSPAPRHYLAPAADTPESVRERKFFALRDGDEGNPFAWEFDLCKVTLGNFRYRKMTLVRDYDELLEAPRANVPFDATFSLSPREVETEEAGTPPAEDRFDIVACDPTQAEAIGLAREGTSYIIQGPPGTGKSQTITNLIADYVSRGKRVLFVCEKRAAIDVVYSRLAQRGLQELCCLIHDSQADKREFVMDLKQTYESFINAAAEGGSKWSSQRKRLDEIIRHEADPLESYAAAVSGAPDEAGASIQALFERGAQLGRNTSRELSAFELERVPFYRHWIQYRPEIDALVDKLGSVQEDLVLAHHPLRMLNPRLHEADRPLEQVLDALDEAEPLLERIADALGGSSLPPELSGSLDDVIETASFAVRADPLARDGLVALLDAENGPGLRFSERRRSDGKRVAALHEIHESNVNWREKLPSSEVGRAREEALRLEGRLTSFVTPGWWRLRRVLRERYDFSAHAVRPTWVSILENLENEYRAKSELETARAEMAEEFGIRGEVAAVIECVNNLTSRSGTADNGGRIRALLELSDPDASVLQLARLETDLDRLQEILGEVLEDHAEMSLEQLLDTLMAIRESLDDLPDFLACLVDLAMMPRELARAFRRVELPPVELEKASLRRTLDSVYRSNRCMRTMNRRQRELHSSRLYSAHVKWLELNSNLLREKARSRFVEHLRLASLPAAQLDDGGVEFKKCYNRGRRDLEHEFGKKMRYKAIRDMVAGESGMVIDDLKPIWLMSPLSVSDTLPLDEGRFEVVIFDEASQITLESAVPALYRAGQAIVVGDEMQLPPTNFFSAKRDDDDGTLWLEDGGEVVEYDLSVNSFLTHAAKNLSSRMLGWHYRSRSESLISFSNWAFYQGRLLTVPEESRSSARRPEIVVAEAAEIDAARADVLTRPISFHRVEHGVYHRRKNRAEADYIARLVRSLLAEDDSPTIGIVAFSEAQQSEIEEAMARLGAKDRRFRESLDAELTREEDGQFVGLLVKNLENIQGDERDIIILSVCYGPAPDGKTRMNFGPINQIGGERRLNVAFSRAKHHMVVVSSIQHQDITNDYNQGANCLKRYLHYAAACSVGDGETATRILRDLCLWRDPERESSARGTGQVVAQIADALTNSGYQVDLAVGMSDFRCDLAVRKDDEEEYRLGILVDSDTTYRAGELLEREVFKPRLLAAFGWRLARVLSQEWYEDRDQVLQHLLAVVENKEPAEEIDIDRSFSEVLEQRLNEASDSMRTSVTTAAIAGGQKAGSKNEPTGARGILEIVDNTPRYFECTTGNSSKFWEITLSDCRYSVHFGRIGTAGQERVKSFADPEGANRAARRMISEKLGKGYEEKPRPGSE